MDLRIPSRILSGTDKPSEVGPKWPWGLQQKFCVSHTAIHLQEINQPSTGPGERLRGISMCAQSKAQNPMVGNSACF